MKKLTVSLALAAALAGTVLATPTPASARAAEASPPHPLRIMPLGDSITFGEGSSTGAGYRGPLWDLMAQQSRYAPDFVGSGRFGSIADPDHEGHSGYTVAGVRAGIDRWQAGAGPDIVLLHLGINDLKNDHTDPVVAAQQLLGLVDRVRVNQPQVTVIVQGLLTDTPGLEQQTAAFNAVVRAEEEPRQASGQRFRYVEAPRMDVAADLPDRLHPSDSGYRKMAAAFRPAIDAAVADGWTSRPARSRAGNEAGGSGALRWADFDGDGKPDHVTIAENGRVSVRLNRGGDVPGGGGWQDLGQVAYGTTLDRKRVRLADFDGDGRFDYLVVNSDGSVNAWINKGGDKAGSAGWQEIGQVATGLTADLTKVRFADWDGDGRTDYLLFNDANNLDVWLNHGGDTAGSNGWQHTGRVTTATHDRNRVRFADNDGDNKADYHLIQPDGKVDLYRNRGGDVVGAGGWTAAGQIATGVTTDHTKVQFVDFNADTHADYILAGTDGSAAIYAWNGGDAVGSNGWTHLGTVTGSASD
ncbi:FG-GAP-like repeat-containing protein [Streptomyces sp. NPDC058662]|uniref:FG-GAP-like repeat-containing protein n=1 Tax=Streptomyces sp. NPDC058662 TaxID=3346583 RepID=UPI0036635716